MRVVFEFGADLRVEHVEFFDDSIKFADDDHRVLKNHFVHEAEAEHLNIVVAISEAGDDHINDLSWQNLELAEKVLEEVVCGLSDGHTMVNSVFERPKINYFDQIFFHGCFTQSKVNQGVGVWFQQRAQLIIVSDHTN